MIRLLLVEDSVTQREILRKLIDATGRLVVVAEARNGKEAVAAVARFQPDVVLMDIHMPDMNGVEATREIMRLHPVPIVIVSATLKSQDVDLGLQALKAGAVSVIEKPQGPVLLHLEKISAQLCQEVIAASKARVSWKSSTSLKMSRQGNPRKSAERIQVIGICASTGGPPVLLHILSQIPKPYPLPVLLVQHIASGFTEGFAKWLAGLSGQVVSVAQGQKPLKPGIWLSPGGSHLEVTPEGRFLLGLSKPGEIHCPSGNALFRSLAKNYGAKAMGILLTGMGDDGADGLRDLRQAGGKTIVQDEESSLIYGMPKAGLEIGAADFQLSPDAIVNLLTTVANRDAEL